jgi:uncharacterized protein YjdB
VARDASNTAVPGVPFQWSSASNAIATVDGNGLVTGVTAGTVNISAAVGSVSGSASVSVTPAPVANVVVTPSTANVPAGQTFQLTATLTDAAGNVLTGRVVQWSSNNASRATVNTAGLVSASTTNKGTVTITATSEGKSGSAIITVQ